jgi:hypothetical protein
MADAHQFPHFTIQVRFVRIQLPDGAGLGVQQLAVDFRILGRVRSSGSGLALFGSCQHSVHLLQGWVDAGQEGAGVALDRFECLEPLPGGFAGLLEVSEERFHGGPGAVQVSVGGLLGVRDKLADKSGKPDFLNVGQFWMGGDVLLE